MNYYAPFYRPSYYPQMPMQNPPENQNQFGQYQQPMMQQPMQPQMPNISPTAPQTSQINDIIWVQGEAGAKAYLVAPNNTVTLWDSENTTIYLKTADANGVPSMRILDFTERLPNAPKTAEKHECQCGNKYASKEQFEALETKFDALEAKFNSISAVTSNMEDN